MIRSKVLFCIIAAVIVIAVMVLITMKPGVGPSEPINTAPDGTVTPGVPVGSDDETEPSEGPVESVPTEPAETSPQSAFVPEEKDPAERPESNGAHYMNHGSVATNVTHDDRLFLISFGLYVEGPNEYLYLNPSVELLSGGTNYPSDFQFCFTPSAGYVTTITDAEYGKHSLSTFVRALDYGLPATYVSEDNPGTVWYMDEDVLVDGAEEYCAYIDVHVFCKGDFLATLRLLLLQDINGTYYMVEIVNLNQLEAGDASYGLEYKLSDAQISKLLELAKEHACTKRVGYTFEEEDVTNLTEADFIIEWRAVGQGTYFDYVSQTNSDAQHNPREDFIGTPLVAVSIRMADSYNRGPMTFYYRIAEDAGENGKDTYELIGIDYPNLYYMRSLYYSDYPGYSNP